jgi:hypothetical protein
MSLFLWKLPRIPDPSNQYTMGIQPPDDLGQFVLSVVLLLFELAACFISVGFG